MTTSTSNCPICKKGIDRYAHIHFRKEHKLTSQEVYDKFIKVDGEGACCVCNKPTKFISYKFGYSESCCVACSNRSPKKKERFRNTCLERYGETAPMKAKEIQDKSKATCLKNHGVENWYQSEECKKRLKETAQSFGVEFHTQRKDIQAKSRETYKARTGYDHNFKNPKVKEQIKQTCLGTYGETHPMKNKVVQDKTQVTNLKRYGARCYWNSKEYLATHEDMSHTPEVNKKRVHTKRLHKEEYIAKGYVERKLLIEECGQGWVKTLDYPYISVSGAHLIPPDYAVYIRENYKVKEGRSVGEIELNDFVSEIYNGKIIRNSRKIIAPFELDIYLPDKKVAIEFNGDWYHSTEKGLPKDYHINKTMLCEEKGIHLIHVFEWEWVNRREYIKSIIRLSLGLYDDAVDFSFCTTDTIDYASAVSFLASNSPEVHYDKFVLFRGVFYRGKMVGVLCEQEDGILFYSKNNIQIINVVSFSKPLRIDRSKYLLKGAPATPISVHDSIPDLHVWNCGYYQIEETK